MSLDIAKLHLLRTIDQLVLSYNFKIALDFWVSL